MCERLKFFKSYGLTPYDFYPNPWGSIFSFFVPYVNKRSLFFLFRGVRKIWGLLPK